MKNNCKLERVELELVYYNILNIMNMCVYIWEKIMTGYKNIIIR